MPLDLLDQKLKSKNYKEGDGGFKVDGDVTLDFPVSSVLSESVVPREERVNLRMVWLKDGYNVMMEFWDQLRRGKILLSTALRNKMYTHGSRIWFQVAKRNHSSRYLIGTLGPDSTVSAIKTWWWRVRWRDKHSEEEKAVTQGDEISGL